MSSGTQDRIIISPGVPKSEIPDDVYDDLEKYIFNGYLTINASISGTRFIFKTMNLREMQYLKLLYPNPESDLSTRNQFRASFIAHSILTVNGLNALLDRSQNINKLTKMIGKFTSSAQELIVDNLATINNRAAKLHQLVEVYVHENKSRFAWFQYKDTPLNSRTVTGFPGSEELALNTCQLTWVALNHLMDRKDLVEADWNHAKFVGGCFTGKGMRSIDEQDNHRKEIEKQEIREKKAEITKRYLSEVKSKEQVVETMQLPDGRTAEIVSRHRPETAEELAESLSRALNNEKDAHDHAVENYFQSVRRRAETIEQNTRALEQVVIPMSEKSSYAISSTEAQNRLQRMRETILKNKERAGGLPDPE